jgi:hypothetical protein
VDLLELGDIPVRLYDGAGSSIVMGRVADGSKRNSRHQTTANTCVERLPC